MSWTNNQKIIAVAAIATTILIAGLIVFYSRPIHTSGIIKSVGLEVYSDAELTTKTENIDWGTIEVGYYSYVDIWIVNTKNTPITLSFQTNNWQPSTAMLYLNLSATINPNAILQPKQAIKVTFTLTVSENTVDIEAFNFDVIIIGTEANTKTLNNTLEHYKSMAI